MASLGTARFWLRKTYLDVTCISKTVGKEETVPHNITYNNNNNNNGLHA
jgi:hypothetical protein